MSFAAPAFLAVLLLLAPAAWLYVHGERRGRRGRAAFATPATRPSVLTRSPAWRRHVAVAVYGFAAALLIVALARPQTTVAVPVEQATVIVATDRSGSMLATDVSPSRLVAARRAAASFVDDLPSGIRVGAIAFNQAPQILASPTRDHASVSEALSSVQAAGTTATGDALTAALRLIASQRKADGRRSPAAIVLLSDGKSVRGADPLEVAAKAKAAGVAVYTVALGTSSSGDNAPDPATLAQIAERSGGRAFEVADAKSLSGVYKRLGSKLATEHRKQEVSSSFAGGALVLMAMAAAASLRWFGRFV
ncbi:MAG TPA: VWA domain-containing protein [Solirubrobacteraceae bacterium]|nr:VWA domain-containing protein [Solirubrobacteraceae bacterium]